VFVCLVYEFVCVCVCMVFDCVRVACFLLCCNSLSLCCVHFCVCIFMCFCECLRFGWRIFFCVYVGLVCFSLVVCVCVWCEFVICVVCVFVCVI